MRVGKQDGMGWDGMDCAGNSVEAFAHRVTSTAHPVPSHPSAAFV